MAKLGDLVVRIGADTRDLNKSLGKVQRNMRSMTSNFTALGTQMTKAITLPILGIGAMAVKSAADLEKMEVSFISLTGGAKQAADMMEQLNEFTAKTPFQIEAVATSARQLIASGTKISEVNEQLQFLGDIAATTGQPINEIAAIFAKVNAKGKVELENLNQLAERGIPIFKALSDATGLLPSELGAGAVSVEQFNATLKSFNEEGGLAEGAMDKLSKTASGKFSTALDNLKLAGAALAEDLLPIVNKLLDKIVELAQRFTALSDSAKKNILVIGGLLAVVGPLLVAIPQLIVGIKATRDAWILLNAAMLLNPIYLVTAAIVALGVVMVATSGDIHNSRKETDKYIQSLKGLDRQASLNSINERIRKEKDKLREANEKLATSELLVARASDKFDRKLATDSVNRYKGIVEGLTGSLSDLKEELDRIHSIDLGADLGADEVVSGGEIIVSTLSDIEKKLLELSRLGTTAMITLSNGVQDFAVNSSASLLAFLNDFTAIGEEIEDVNEGVKDSFTTLADTINAEIERGVEAMIGGVALMVGAAVGAEKPIEGIGAFLGETLAQMAINIGEYAIAHGTVIEAIKASLISLQGMGAIIAGAALIALGAGMKSAIQKNAENAGVPALAEGGLMYGPSLIVAGDNKNANIDPEVVAPLSKLKDMLGGNSIQVYGRISGDDIVISNNRASRDRNRF